MNYTLISEQQYNEFLTNSEFVRDGFSFTSFGGPHDFSTIVIKEGMLYDVGYGWYPEKDEDPNAKYPYKTTYWWGYKRLQMSDGQLGDGI